MRNFVQRFRSLGVASSRFQLGQQQRSLTSLQCLHRLLEGTNDPLWNSLQHFQRPELLRPFYVKSLNDWADVAFQPDIDAALDALRTRGYSNLSAPINDDDDNGSVNKIQVDAPTSSFSSGRHPRPPTWLFFYLAIYKVHSGTHASGALLSLLSASLSTLSVSLQPAFIVLALLHLSRFNLLAPMRQLMRSFLSLPLPAESPLSALYFNLFLQSLADTPSPSIENANIVVTVLQAMDARQISLTSEAYDALLNDRFVTLQLTKYLRYRMTLQGHIPTANQLEAYLRIFAKGGAIHDADEYYLAIHEGAVLGKEKGREKEVEENRALRSNTIMLAAQEDRASAFAFLKRLRKPETPRFTVAVPQTEEADNLQAINQPPDSSTSTPPFPPAKYIKKYKSQIDIYDYTAMLTVSARDPRTAVGYLCHLFELAKSQSNAIAASSSASDSPRSGPPPLHPTTVTYTVLLRGLYARKAYKTALDYFHELLRHNSTGLLSLDRKALTIGIQLMLRRGKLAGAFDLLEKRCGGAGDDDPVPLAASSTSTKKKSRSKSGSGDGNGPHRPPMIRLSSVSINTILVTLNRIQRPDLVLFLWDHMGPLYGVAPNTVTFSILLQSARMLLKMGGAGDGPAEGGRGGNTGEGEGEELFHEVGVLEQLKWEMRKATGDYGRQWASAASQPSLGADAQGEEEGEATTTTTTTTSYRAHLDSLSRPDRLDILNTWFLDHALPPAHHPPRPERARQPLHLASHPFTLEHPFLKVRRTLWEIVVGSNMSVLESYMQHLVFSRSGGGDDGDDDGSGSGSGSGSDTDKPAVEWKIPARAIRYTMEEEDPILPLHRPGAPSSSFFYTSSSPASTFHHPAHTGSSLHPAAGSSGYHQPSLASSLGSMAAAGFFPRLRPVFPGGGGGGGLSWVLGINPSSSHVGERRGSGGSDGDDDGGGYYIGHGVEIDERLVKRLDLLGPSDSPDGGGEDTNTNTVSFASHHPTIPLSNAHVLNYILLLSLSPPPPSFSSFFPTFSSPAFGSATATGTASTASTATAAAAAAMATADPPPPRHFLRELPLLLLWMHNLGVQPSRSTVAAALVLWAEISIPSPVVESLARWGSRRRAGSGSGSGAGAGAGYKSEYAKLVGWVHGWVGDKRMPTAERVRKWHAVISAVRGQRIVDGGGEDQRAERRSARGRGEEDWFDEESV